MKERAQSGTIFAEKISNGRYMFGRILMDVEVQCKEPGLISPSDLMWEFKSDYLIEVFDSISEQLELPYNANVVFSGLMIDSLAFEEDKWIIAGRREVEPSTIDFQEDIWYDYDDEIVTMKKGEVELTAPFEADEADELDGISSLGSVNLFNVVLTYIGKKELAKIPLDISRYDKRFIDQKIREKVYTAFGEDPEMSYLELARKHGFDTLRFFKQ